MGVPICRLCSKNRDNEEIIFTNRKPKENDSTFGEQIKLYKVKQNNNNNNNNFLSELEYHKAKASLELSIKQKGDFLENTNIEELLEQKNPIANKINISREITQNNDSFSIQEPLIRFFNGEIYEGGWNLKNQRNGFGISISKEGNVFKGMWENDNFGKYGAFIENNGNYYIGYLEKGKAKGKGEIFINNKMKYKGDFNDDLPNGKGILENFEEKSIYDGNVVNGVKEGYGELKFEDGIIYKGEFKDNKFDGKGKIIYPNGREYEGEFKNNKMEGDGVFTWEDGKKYEGNYIDNIKQGHGKLAWNENKYYEGDWFNNKPHGDGMYYLNGKLLKGKFRFGKIISQQL